MILQEIEEPTKPGPETGVRAGMLQLMLQAGVSDTALSLAIVEADRLGVDLVHHILSEGLVEEAAFYAELARHMGLPFHDRMISTAPMVQPAHAIHTGLCPLRHAGRRALSFAVAPKGAMLQRLMTQDLRGRRDIVVMTPSRLAASVRLSHASLLAQQAAGLDTKGRARRGAYDGLSLGQIVFLGALVFSLSFSITLQPLQALTAIALVAWPIFLVMASLRITAIMKLEQTSGTSADPFSGPTRDGIVFLTDDNLPVYSVIVPLCREAAVLEQLLSALDALDYPRAKLDIKIVVEPDDAETRDALAKTSLPPHIQIVVMPFGLPRTKPRALNAGLSEATGSLVTIFDAEDIPDPGQLRDAANHFASRDAELGCLQARLVIDNGEDNWLTRCFALEYAGLFDVINPGLLRRGMPILLGGTSNHFRMSAVRSVGGWDAWNVTEDADLGIRLVRAGYRIEDLPSVTFEEAPATFALWFRQRARWMKGYMQTIATHSDRPFGFLRDTGPAAALVFMALSLGTVISALGYPVFLSALVMWALGFIEFDQSTWHGQALSGTALFVFLAGFAAMILPAAFGAMRRKSINLMLGLPVLPLYYGLVSLAAWRAIFDCVVLPFHWNKTEHGLARTSRRRQAVKDVSATLPLPVQADAPGSARQ
jgi:glycosyltransferase XagB